MTGSYHFDKKAKRYFIQFNWNGKKYRFWRNPVTQDPIWHENTATKLLFKLRAEVDDGSFNPRAWEPNNPLTMKSFAVDWLNCLSLAKTTMDSYRTAVNRYIIPFFGDKDIRSIKYADILKFQKSINKTNKTVYNKVSVLKAMLRFAWKNEDIKTVPPFPTLSFDIPEIEFLTYDDQQMVLGQIPDRDRPIFRFLMYLGTRTQEARALKKDCLVDSKIVIKRAFSVNKLVEFTKTHDIRYNDITPTLQDIFDSVESHLSPFVFVRDDGCPYTNKNLNKIWADACKSIGIKIPLNHGCRHSLGCQLLEQEEDMDLVRQQLGHTRIETTRRYAKRSTARLTDALLRRDNQVNRSRGGNGR